MTMTKTQVLTLLRENRNERGIANWKKKPRNIHYGDDNSCEPLDVLKHLTSDYVKKKLGL